MSEDIMKQFEEFQNAMERERKDQGLTAQETPFMDPDTQLLALDLIDALMGEIDRLTGLIP